jgi:hypothetical protein
MLSNKAEREKRQTNAKRNSVGTRSKERCASLVKIRFLDMPFQEFSTFELSRAEVASRGGRVTIFREVNRRRYWRSPRCCSDGNRCGLKESNTKKKEIVRAMNERIGHLASSHHQRYGLWDSRRSTWWSSLAQLLGNLVPGRDGV